MIKRLLIACLILVAGQAVAQRNIRDSVLGTPWVAVHYGGSLPQADLQDRFGYLNNIGFLAGYKTKHNWLYAVEGNFLFGNKIKENSLLNQIKDSYNQVTDINGDPGMIYVHARGLQVNLTVGKVIPIFNSNKNSGLFLHGGVGYLLHKYRIETQEQVIPLLELDYKRGYDRLSSGINFHQFAGYTYMSESEIVNFYAGAYVMQGLTKYRRDEFYDQPGVAVDSKTHLDITVGFKVGWMVPIYRRVPQNYYLY